MAINYKRTEAMRRKTTNELMKIWRSGSLSSAAARYELDRRAV